MEQSDEEELGALYLAADAALERGNIERARRDFELVLLEAPRFAPAWDGLGRCYDADGDLAKAGECFRKASRLDRGNWLSRYHWGLALHRTGELDEACRRLREAARVAPKERCIHHRLGMCLFDLGEFELALQSYRKALEQPEHAVTDAELYVAIGTVEAERGNLEEADEAYQRACLLSPDDPNVYFNWAVLTARTGDPDGAERLAARARALDRRSLRSTLLLVDLALANGNRQRAEELVAELSGRPDAARLAVALQAELALRGGDKRRARDLALDALRTPGPPTDHALDKALQTLRGVSGVTSFCKGFRLLIEVECGDQAYYRPFVILAEDEDQARWFVADLQDALDDKPWRVVESETFAHDEEAQPGVYQLLLTRVLFPRAPTEPAGA